MSAKSSYFVNETATLGSLGRTLRSGRRRKHVKVEYEKDKYQVEPQKEGKFAGADISAEDSHPSTSKRTRKKIDGNENKTLAQWQPRNWQEQLKNIQEMRRERNAAVDHQGCERTADIKAPPTVQRYQVLVSLMLSSQTKDQITFEATRKLKEKGLTIENILQMPESQIAELIKPVGFWKKKASFIKKVTEICHRDYQDDIPPTVEELVKLPGVGPKMAHIAMNVAWNKLTGIGVDTHVHRISNRLGWVKKTTSTPEHTRVALESWLPRDEWREINVLLVGFGQQICLPVKPHCNECLNAAICPYPKSNKKK